MKASSDAYQQVSEFRKSLTERTDALKNSASKETSDAIAAFEKKVDALDKGTRRAPAFGPVNRELARLIFSLESADMGPTDAAQLAVQQSCDALDKDLANLRQLNEQDLAAFNAVVVANKQAPLPTVTGVSSTGCKP